MLEQKKMIVQIFAVIPVCKGRDDVPDEDPIGGGS